MNKQKALLSRPALFDDALITSFYRFGEVDCIVKLFTRTSGRICTFYKKGYEHHVALGLARIAHAQACGQRMARLYMLDSDPNCFIVGSSLKLFAYCSYICELIEKLLPEHEVLEPVFDLTLTTYQTLINKGPSSAVLRAFELKLLDFLGYLPEFPWPEEDYFYDMGTCCFIRHDNSQSFKISRRALEITYDLLNLPIKNIIIEEQEELITIGKIFHSRLKLLGLMPLKSLAFFKQVRS